MTEPAMMREPPTRLLDELSRMMTGAVGLAQGVRNEADSLVRSQIERILRDADFVSREEFEAVRTMAIAALSALPPQISSKAVAFSFEPRPGTRGV
jgi:BMFP domain-containing protein YqiC